MSLNKKVALVTGASRGIGRAVALALAREGAWVGVNYAANAYLAGEVVDMILAGGGQAVALEGNVSDGEAAASVVDQMVARFGRLDILVNNAGITRDSLLLRMKESDWHAVLDTNLTGVFNCTRSAARHMLRQRWGRIINITSVAGLTGNPGQANYAAAKAGVVGFTKTVAAELASRGITVNAVAPGLITTDMTKRMASQARDELAARIPVGRAGEPEDVAAAVVFMASEVAGYITGQVLVVDGGLSL